MNNQLKTIIYGLGASLIGRKFNFRAPQHIGNICHPNHFLRVLQSQNTQDFAIAFLDKNGEDAFLTSSVHITQDTPFRLASVTKFVIGIAVLRLQEKGKLDIHADVSDYLGYFLRNPKHPDTAITLRHILSHSSGLLDSPAYFAAMQSLKPFQDVLAFHDGKPGARFVYSNFAYGLVEIMLERITGQALETILEQEVFAPLGIKGTLFPNMDSGIPPIYRVFPKRNAPNYVLNNKTIEENKAYILRPLEERYIKAAGALFMSAKDLLILLKALLHDVAGKEPTLLSHASIKIMHTSCVDYPKPERRLYHGLSTLIVEDSRIWKGRLYGHQGFAYGAVNGVFYDPVKQAAFVSLNAGTREWRNGHFSICTEELLQAYAKELA